MVKNIRFTRKERFFILSKFTEVALNKVSTIMLDFHKETGSNKFNFYTIEEQIKLLSLNTDYLELIKKISFGVEFTEINIDENIHDINKKRIMSAKVIESFKGLPLHVVFTSKIYKIEKEISKNILKLEGLKEDIDLLKIDFEYEIR